MKRQFLSLIAVFALLFLPLANADLLDTYSVGFDFGTGSVETGYIGVAAAESYSLPIGYGWTSITNIAATDRGGDSPNKLQSDFLLCNDGIMKTFLVNVPNGYYDVTVSVGDASYEHNNTYIYLQNTLVSASIYTAAAEFNATTYHNIESTESSLTISIVATGGSHWCLNYILITAVEDPNDNPAATENIFYTGIIFAVICLNLAVGWISKGWVVPATFGIISISIAVATLFTSIYGAIIFSPWLQIILLCVAIFNLYGVVLVARK